MISRSAPRSGHYTLLLETFQPMSSLSYLKKYFIYSVSLSLLIFIRFSSYSIIKIVVSVNLELILFLCYIVILEIHVILFLFILMITWRIHMQLTIEDKTIIFNVHRSKRKSFLLDITPEGHITIKSPSKSTETEIMAFVKSHSKTLLDLQSKLENRKYISSSKSYTNEENFLYLGKAHLLSELLGELPSSNQETQMLLKQFYTAQTKKIVNQRIKHFGKSIGVKTKSITIVNSPSTWGTCNSRGELTFNYKLSMASLSVIDYVIIHELCHILHLNHDRSFWRKVGMFDPDYKKHEAYLSHFGIVMTI